jgi:type I restriction enzyme S subunit
VNNLWPKVKLGEILIPVSRPEAVDAQKTYRILGAHWYAKGLYVKDIKSGSQIQAKKLYRVEHGDFVYNRLFAWKGSFAVASEQDHGCYVSNEFPYFLVDENRADSRYLWKYFSREGVWEEALGLSTGGTPTSRNRLKEEKLLAMGIPLPPLQEQRRIVAKIDDLAEKIEEARKLNGDVAIDINMLLESARLKIFQEMASRHGLRRLDEVAPINMGQSPPGESYNTFGESVPLLNGPTEFGENHPVPVQWTTAPTKLCKPGDILLCVRGATTGKLNWADQEYCIGRGLAALTPNPKVCLPEYVFYFVETQTQEMLGLAAGSTFPNLPGEKLKVLEIPVPPIPDQRRVAGYLDSIQEKVKSLMHLQSQTAAELEVLLPSILHKAFKGEL